MIYEYLEKDEWKIIEKGFDPESHERSESIFSLGNGTMGQRANFEEDYSGKSLQGNYVAGVYYPDKTKVGWWKNGYPEYFAKVLNACNWIGIRIEIDGISLDLDQQKPQEFERVLNMKEGYLERSFVVEIEPGKQIKVVAKRFLSMTDNEVGAIRYSITPLNFNGSITWTPYLDFDVRNADANWDDNFWQSIAVKSDEGKAMVHSKTKKSGFSVAVAMRYHYEVDGKAFPVNVETSQKEAYAENRFSTSLEEGKEHTLFKYAGLVSSMNYSAEELSDKAYEAATRGREVSFDILFQEHVAYWAEKWSTSDILIDGDVSAQQGIRFNIFHLNQTFTGVDERLNIGPKGFTGEKYGGSTYWDTEAYCLPFYLSTSPQEVSKNLLKYRYKHLRKAIENAEKLGFKDGAALYPMVTMNGEECHNEWEITFEEIHRNAAIAYAVYDYLRHTDDLQYIADMGLEVLIGISRFWAQRVNWSEAKEKYVMLGVTGPNEYENNVNNNWYTNTMATWCMRFTNEMIDAVQQVHPTGWEKLAQRTSFKNEERAHWKEIIEKIHLPYDETKDVFLQQDGFLDKDLTPVSELAVSERPINQFWSWDRILRSCYIKQADVLQGFFFLEHEFTKEQLQKNFDFYEPLTVHESSLSPCVHVVLAARLAYHEKAYEMYMRTSRLDLDDYNHEVHEGLHITSMAGTWMSVVQGFGGKHVVDGQLHFDPLLPKQWNKLSFTLLWKGSALKVSLDNSKFEVRNEGEKACKFYVRGNEYVIPGHEHLEIN